ncbi:hypothetical protein [Roseibium sediminis]|uniref:hypothetical protein n=1 Tax=Roseibium sediminis TaxID=1775174 RepID=UPI00123C8011|nr:hypothetical protein [Roseibium sediminis]
MASICRSGGVFGLFSQKTGPVWLSSNSLVSSFFFFLFSIGKKCDGTQNGIGASVWFDATALSVEPISLSD